MDGTHAKCPFVIISTPDRDRLNRSRPGHNGPPTNPCHVREWNKPELFNFVKSFDFLIVDHIFVPGMRNISTNTNGFNETQLMILALA